MSDETRARDEIATVGKSLFDRGLTAGSSGNISVRLDDGWLITPTNSSLGSLDPAQIAKVDLSGRHISGLKPSKEWFFHHAVYGARGRAGAVVHLHSTYSVAVSCLDGIDPCNCLPPLTAYYVMRVGTLPLVPYHRPGDPALGPAVGSLAAKHSAVLLANHGPIVAGKNLEAAQYATEELEETAKLYLLLHERRVRLLTEGQIADLHQHFPPED